MDYNCVKRCLSLWRCVHLLDAIVLGHCSLVGLRRYDYLL